MSLYMLQSKDGSPLQNSALNISAGIFQGVSHINKFGRLDEVPADTETPVWSPGGSYVFPTSAVITHVSQAVDQVAMRGQDIVVQGLDADFAPVTQTVTLDATNTTTQVALTTPLIRCFRAYVESTTDTTSDIEIHDDGNTQVYAEIPAGENQTLMAIYTVPAGCTGFLTNMWAYVADATNKTPTSTTIKLMAALNEPTPLVRRTKMTASIGEGRGGLFHQFYPFKKFTEKTDVFLVATARDWPARIDGGFDMILVENVHLT